MGQFIDQVQALNSEAKQKRLSREQKEREKHVKDILLSHLKNTLTTVFEVSKTSKNNTYLKLLNNDKKDNIIFDILKAEKIKDNRYGFYANYLNNIYYKTLNSIKNSYLIIEKNTNADAKMLLYNKIKNSYNDYDVQDYLYVYRAFLHDDTRNAYINEITQDERTKELLHYNYMTILNKASKPYLELYKSRPQKKKSNALLYTSSFLFGAIAGIIKGVNNSGVKKRR